MNSPLLAFAASILAPAATAQEPLLHAPNLMWPETSNGRFVLADLDADGDLDVVEAPAALHLDLRLLRNDGSGGLREDVGAIAQPGGPAASFGEGVVFDADGDGDADVAFGRSTTNLLYLQRPNGTFVEAPGALGGQVVPSTAVGVVDRDLDGDLDLVFGNVGQDQLLDNAGAAVFVDATAIALPVDATWTSSVETGDADNDGDPDLLLGGEPARLALQSAGVFAYAPFPQPAPERFFGELFAALGAIRFVDVDHDADLDVIGGTVGSVLLHDNVGGGSFAAGTTLLTATGGYLEGLQVGDVDGDGEVDVLASYTTFGFGAWSPTTDLLVGDGLGGFTTLWTEPDSNAASFPLGDVDGDLDLDVVAPSPVGHLLNDGQGNLVDWQGPAQDLGSPLALAVGDVDGDGFDDLVTTSSVETRLFLADGGFHDPAPAQVLPAAQDAALGDVDGDGDGDLLLAPPQLYLWNGAAFASAPAALPSAPGAERVAFGDLDGDGDLDATLTPGNGFKPMSLWLGDGAGGFVDASAQVPAVALGVLISDVELGDVDGDGDLDVLIAGQSTLLVNDGTATFADASAQLPASSVAKHTALFDADGDGDLDVAATRNDGPRLWSNVGAGTFVDATATALPPTPDEGEYVGIAAGDFDGDGHPDLYVASSYDANLLGGAARLLLGDGAGSFSEAPGLVPVLLEHQAGPPVAADLDRDGDLDVVTTNGLGSIRVNHTRHLERRGPARIGKTMFVDVDGPASEPYVVAAAFGSASIELTGFGLLQLDPQSIAVTLGGMLDANGEAVVSIPVPNDAALLGVDTRWQALVGQQPRFTNAEKTVPTAL